MIHHSESDPEPASTQNNHELAQSYHACTTSNSHQGVSLKRKQILFSIYQFLASGKTLDTDIWFL